MPLDAKRIEKPISEIRNFLKKAPKRPGTGQIHDLRTSARRLEANIEALGLLRKRSSAACLPKSSLCASEPGKFATWTC